MPNLDLVVGDIVQETALIRRLRMRRADGKALPGFAAGAHVTLALPGIGERKYSLVNAQADASATASPHHYEIAVRREDGGEGGSRYIHTLENGARLSVAPPENKFPLKASSKPIVLIGGGIGVTPLVSMAAELKAKSHPFRFYYAARNAGEFAFLPELRRLAENALTLHADDEAGQVFALEAVFDTLSDGEPVYICGPKPMLKAAIQSSRKREWPAGRLSYELFYSIAPLPKPTPIDDGSFEIVLKSSGKSFRVPREKSILDVLIEAGLDPLHDCKRGECGVCQVGVLEGEIDHRDSILSDTERAAGKLMQICVSRAKSARLVLDL